MTQPNNCVATAACGIVKAGWTIASIAAVLMTTFSSAYGANSQQHGSTIDPLRAGFQLPPQEARPRVWWHWINGNVNLEGAKKDLEWMQRVGIGGVHTFSGGVPGAPTVVSQRQPFMSAGWKQAFSETTQIARAAGMEVGVAGSPGWSLTGGPWVSPEDGMKKYVWSETRVLKGIPFDGVLATPPTVTGPFQTMNAENATPTLYRDTLVIAFPTPRAEREIIQPALSSSAQGIDLSLLQRDDASSKLSLPITAGDKNAEGDEGVWIEARYPKRITLSAVTMTLPAGAAIEIQYADADNRYRTVAQTIIASPNELTHPLPQQTVAFPATSAKTFRVLLTPIAQPAALPMGPGPAPAQPKPPKKIQISQIRFEAGARVNRFQAKAGFQPTISADDVATPNASTDAAIPRRQIIDLTEKLQSDGRLHWAPPKGDWTILRFGWSLTGRRNAPAEPEATGLEVDKLDAAAVQRYIDKYLALYDDTTGGKLGTQGVQTLLTDSWEAGVQNWTPALLNEFRARRGYDAVPFLPALAGRVVDSADSSDRFLWDFRQTLKDLIADNHYRVLADTLHARDMRYYAEVQGDTPRAIADGMTLKARSDIPTAEYWYRPFAAGPGQFSLKADLEEAASAAHVYGKPLAAAESLTVAAARDPWAFSPRILKPVVDEIFAHGINRILMHDSHHQPLIDAKPGLMLMIFGQFFNRNDTWAEDAKPWVDYLSRTSFMLQQGHYVADVAYFYGEDKTLTELFRQRENTDIPAGYRYDYINPEALLSLLSVKDNQLVTPSGMRYRVLFIPPHVSRLTLPAMRKLRELIQEGAVLVGNKPVGGFGLASADREIISIASEIWGDDASPSTREVGNGRIYTTIEAALIGEKITPDFSFAGRTENARLLTLHRKTADADIYFVSNQQASAETLTATFRVNGKEPELWRAETGTAERLSYRQTEHGIELPLTLNPSDALFVVFRNATDSQQWQAPTQTSTLLTTLEGPWSLQFEPRRGASQNAIFDQLKSWSDVDDVGIKYFSGSATYKKNVNAPRAWFQDRRRFVLDLGDVRELAVVTVNGKTIGTAWHSPYQLDITSALRIGKNDIGIRVVNLWPNRLIGDKQPNATPITFAPQSTYRADSPLLTSGLLGPVTLTGVDSE